MVDMPVLFKLVFAVRSKVLDNLPTQFLLYGLVGNPLSLGLIGIRLMFVFIGWLIRQYVSRIKKIACLLARFAWLVHKPLLFG